MKNYSSPKKRLILNIRNSWLSIGLLLVLVLSSCNINTTEVPSSQTVYQDIQTSVAGTVTSQVTVPATTTATALPIATLASTATPAEITASPTSQVSYSYVYYTCGDSEFVKDMTIADETVLEPGEEFTKTWKLENTGNCTWTSSFSIVFISGDDMDGSDTGIDQTVYIGKKGEISVELTAPDDEDTYTGYWQMADAYGYTFGEIVHVKIVVEEADPTSTPTATNTVTATSTPTYTSTPIVTSPTATVTSAPTIISTPEPDTATPTNTSVPISTPEADTPTSTPTTATSLDNT